MTNDERKEVLELLVRIDERTESLSDEVGHLMRIVALGNGSKALTVQVAELNERMDGIEEVKAAKWSTIGVAITAAAGLILGLVQLLG